MNAVVRAYIRDYRKGAKAELDYYASLPTLKEAVRRAGRAERPDGKRHDHQTRIRRDSIARSSQRLMRMKLARCSSFDELHSILDDEIRSIPGIGELMVYDTALRIGARLSLRPRYVYLHAGTRSGARALGVGPREKKILASSLPKELSKLQPHEIEDCLCIYKAALARIGASRRAKR